MQSQERKFIAERKTQIIDDLQQKRRKNFTQKIWKREQENESLGVQNPNLSRPKRDLLGGYLLIQASNKTLPPKSALTEASAFGKTSCGNFPSSSADVPETSQTRPKTRMPPQLYQIFGGIKSSKILDRIVQTSQKGLLGKALTVVQKRHEESENIPKDRRETIFETVEKANSIYVIDLTTRMINDEIERLKQFEADKKAAIATIERNKEAEFVRFRENFERVKRVTEQTVEQANKVAKKKTALIKEIKAKGQVQGLLKHDTKKLEDLASYYTELKRFLTVVSPDYFKEKKLRDM